MSDSLELLLKEAVKRIVQEAVQESLQANKGALAQVAPPPTEAIVEKLPSATRQAFNKSAIWREKYKIACKSAKGAMCALGLGGVLTMGLFAPEFARAAIDYGYVPDTPAQYTDAAANVSWEDLANMDTVEQMVKQGAILHARPEDLAAIVIFHELRKMARGEPIRLENMQQDFKDSLPDTWVPVYDALVAQYPQMPLPDMGPGLPGTVAFITH